VTAAQPGVDGVFMPVGRDASRLVVPEGWVIDEVARERLRRSLDRAPSHIAGVAAGTGELPSGASYRVRAEWAELDSPPPAESMAPSARGAVLVRPGSEFAVRDDVVYVAGGSLLLDPGAHVHDPWRSIGPLEVASERGRPPFPRRPVVALVAGERDGDLADWARRLVNRLVRRDVEGRLLVREATEGLHLTRPCTPCPESIQILAPDAVVALDASAKREVGAWCGVDRSTVVIELDSDMPETLQLVSWQVDRARGRVRARISRRITAAALVELVHRLCAGPHPMPPADVAPADRVDLVGTSRRGSSAAVPTAAIVIGVLVGPASARADGIVDHLGAAGVAAPVTRIDPADRSSSAESADLALLIGSFDPDHAHDLIDRRQSAGRPTVLDLSVSDLESASSAVDAGPVLTTQAARLATACGLVTSPGVVVDAAARRLGIRAHILPVLVTRARVEALDQARAAVTFGPPTERVVGWTAPKVGPSGVTHLDAAAEGIAKLLAADADVRVEFVGKIEQVPAALRGHDRVTTLPEAIEPATVAGWTVHLWTPTAVDSKLALDDPTGVVEAGFAGVPSVLPAGAQAAIGGPIAPDLIVSDANDPEAWIVAMRSLFDDPGRRARLGTEAMRLSLAVWGPAASKSAVLRLLSWARYPR
jgi:hypothetical protein